MKPEHPNVRKKCKDIAEFQRGIRIPNWFSGFFNIMCFLRVTHLFSMALASCGRARYGSKRAFEECGSRSKRGSSHCGRGGRGSVTEW